MSARVHEIQTGGFFWDAWKSLEWSEGRQGLPGTDCVWLSVICSRSFMRFEGSGRGLSTYPWHMEQGQVISIWWVSPFQANISLPLFFSPSMWLFITHRRSSFNLQALVFISFPLICACKYMIWGKGCALRCSPNPVQCANVFAEAISYHLLR